MPSRRNMRRICDFFAVTEAELLLSPNRFAELVTLTPRRTLAPAESAKGADFLWPITKIPSVCPTGTSDIISATSTPLSIPAT
jgi:hypothetical protein